MDIIKDELQRNNTTCYFRAFSRQNGLNHVISIYYDSVRLPNVYTHVESINFAVVSYFALVYKVSDRLHKKRQANQYEVLYLI